MPDGRLLASCPFALVARADVAEVRSHYFWREKGALDRADLPAALIHAIDEFAAGVADADRELLKRPPGSKGESS